MARWNRFFSLALASQAVHHVHGEIVEASTVTNVVVTASAWDVRSEADGGCGVGGCDPRLTRDGKDNTVPGSRWSCEPSLDFFSAGSSSCRIEFTMDNDFIVDHIILYLHESDDVAQVSIPFDIQIGYADVASDLTGTGIALGEGQQVDIPKEPTYYSSDDGVDRIELDFELTNGQYINLSELEIYLDVDDPDDAVVVPTELYVVNAKTVTNVVATSEYWDLRSDAGCGAGGCTPSFVTDGKNNANVTSGWSCQVESDFGADDFLLMNQRCRLTLTMDDPHVISHIIVYIADSDDETEEGISFSVESTLVEESYQTTPGTALGTGERFNLPRPVADYIEIYPNPTSVEADQVITISEVEIYVEVTDTNVAISAAEAWTEVPAESLTLVTTASSQSQPGFAANQTLDGKDNTVATSRWSCTGDSLGNCIIFFGFNDEYTVSYVNLYMHDSDAAAKEAVELDICICEDFDSYSFEFTCNCVDYFSPDTSLGTFVTEPGTPLGEPERMNTWYKGVSGIAVMCRNLTAIGGTLDISEVEIMFRVPDSTPTPAPFVEDSRDPIPTFAPFSPSFNFDDDIFGPILDDDSSNSRVISHGILLASVIAVVVAIIQ